MPGLAWVDGACGGWLDGIGENISEVWAESHWELFRWDPVLSCVEVAHGVDGVGVELRSSWLGFWILM